MPGTHLNDLERGLSKTWASNNMPRSSLLSIRINGEKAIRGLNDVEIEFKYPVTVICGRNGSGKTTILGLASLAYNGDGTYQPTNTKRKYYTFGDFFYEGPGDESCIGVHIEWRIKDERMLQLTKQSSKWMHYERRPKRAIQYIGTNRILSATERKVLRAHFKPDQRVSTRVELNDVYRGYLNDILSNEYDNAIELSHFEYTLRSCTVGGVSYSSFNMGAGEDVIIELLSTIQNLPDGALCVIEEIELGIHPEALKKLALVLQQIAKKRKIQFVISSHSSDFIDALPREARVFLNRRGTVCNVISSPSTRYAMGKMTNERFPELSIICEDEMASCILRRALPNEVRRRVELLPLGSKDELVKLYLVCSKINSNFKGLIVWDGDVNSTSGIVAKAEAEIVPYAFLHSSATPEENIIRDILGQGVSCLANRLNMDSEEELRLLLNQCLIQSDKHNFAYELANVTNMQPREILDCCISVAVECTSDKYVALIAIIKGLLDGENIDSYNHNRS